MLQPINAAPSRTEQVYNALRDSICAGELEPGRHLIQEELADYLAVSRQPVQQALLLLRNDGLVVDVGRRGLQVAPLDPTDIVQRYQIRLLFDQLAARLVAERALTEAGFAAQLRHDAAALLARGQRAAQGQDAVASVAQDVAFHCFLYAQSGNALLAPSVEVHWLFLRRAMIEVLRKAKRGALVWEQHRQIIDLLAAGDVQASVALASEHVLGAQQALLGLLPANESSNRPAALERDR